MGDPGLFRTKSLGVWRGWAAAIALAAVLAPAFLVAAATPVAAVTIVVDDDGDAGPGTFRQAIVDASGAAGPRTIVFAPGLEVELVTGEVTYSGLHDLTIQGNGSTVSGGNSSRILRATHSDMTITIESMHLVDGDAAGNGGAVETPGAVTVVGSTLTGNVAAGDGGALWAGHPVSVVDSTFIGNVAGGDGGAVTTGMRLTIEGSTFNDNEAQGQGGALWAAAAGSDAIVVAQSTFEGNTADGDGGAVFTSFGDVTVTGSVFEDNRATGVVADGGAIRALRVTAEATQFIGNSAAMGGAVWAVSIGRVTATDTVFADNTARGDGGAVGAQGVTIVRAVFSQNAAEGIGGSAGQGGAISVGNFDSTITDSTFAHNEADTVGGAIRVAPNGPLTIVGSTFAHNTAGTDGGAVYAQGPAVSASNATFTANAAGGAAGALSTAGDLTLTHVTVSANEGATQVDANGALTTFGTVVAAPLGGANCQIGGVTSSTFSYDTGATCGFTHATDTSNGANPQLGALADNGGLTDTTAPAPASPLVDAIPPCGGVDVDQRGVARPQGKRCDIGAVELDTAAKATEPGIVRYGGPNRFGTAALLSAAKFPPGVGTVYIATGADYPDALTGAIAAALEDAPLLLVEADGIPDDTEAELLRLAAGRIVILGGTAAVSAAVETGLAAFTDGPVERLSGPNRYGTAAAVSQATFPDGADIVYVATGLNFPDALSGVPAGATAPGPLLLVTTDEVPAETVAELERLDPQTIVMLGGVAAVSDAAAAQLGQHAATVDRVFGPTRYATAAAVSADTFPDPEQADTVFIATGEAFPDALAAGAVAGATPAPVLLTEPGNLPLATTAELTRLAPVRIVIMGGVAAVSAEVEADLVAYLAD